MSDTARGTADSPAHPTHALLADWPGAAVLAAADGRVHAASPGARELLHVADDAPVPPLQTLLGDDVGTRLVSSSVDGEVVELDTDALPWERRVLEVASRVRADGDVLIELRDAVGEHRLRRHLEQAERLASVGELLSSVAHELNNPLTTVLGYAEVLLADDLAADAHDELQQIRGEAQRCRRIVGNLLDLSRAEQLELQPISLTQVADKVVEIRSYATVLREIALESDVSTEAPYVAGDFHRLVQAVLNLVTNAEQSVSSRASDRRILVRVDGDETTCRLLVEDNGPGVPEALREAVFQPFFTTKPRGQGTGLGLSLVRATAHAHDGTIRVEAGEEGGARFVLELPRHTGF